MNMIICAKNPSTSSAFFPKRVNIRPCRYSFKSIFFRYPAEYCPFSFRFWIFSDTSCKIIFRNSPIKYSMKMHWFFNSRLIHIIFIVLISDSIWWQRAGSQSVGEQANLGKNFFSVFCRLKLFLFAICFLVQRNILAQAEHMYWGFKGLSNPNLSPW